MFALLHFKAISDNLEFANEQYLEREIIKDVNIGPVLNLPVTKISKGQKLNISKYFLACSISCRLGDGAG